MMYKFTKFNGTTEYTGIVQTYHLPTPDKNGGWKLGKWTEPIDGIMEIPDGRHCGPNRLHLMKELNSSHAPHGWVCWEAEGDVLFGEDHEKASFRRVRLLGPVNISALIKEDKINKTTLHGANLYGADLRGVDLELAHLSTTILLKSDLREAKLRGAKLWRANLIGADLRGADLGSANLRGADLREAKLRGANLKDANLIGARLGDLQKLMLRLRMSGAMF